MIAVASSVGAQTPTVADAVRGPLAVDAARTEEAERGSGFFSDVWSDYRSFISIDNAKWLASGGTFALAIHPADQPLASDLQHEAVLTTSSLKGGQQYGLASVQVPVAIAWWAVGAALGGQREAEAGRDLLRGQIGAVSWTYAFKFVADRTRPNGDPRSFPSGHASSAFATAWVLQAHYGWKVG